LIQEISQTKTGNDGCIRPHTFWPGTADDSRHLSGPDTEAGTLHADDGADAKV
jgi:hypothetical protein